MKRIIFLSFVLIAAWQSVANGQTLDSLVKAKKAERRDGILQPDTLLPAVDSAVHSPAPDSTKPVKKSGFVKRLLADDYPNPNKALIMAAVFPGAGQMYNKRWWKVPLVYGAYTGAILYANYNQGYYRRFRDAYIADIKGQQHEFSNTRLKRDDLRRLRDKFDKDKQFSYILIFLVHMTQAAEAFVDCHLKTFDVSDDISFKLKPSIGTMATGETYMGIGLAFRLN